MAEKKTKGKQKIEIRKVENDEDRMTTFSKRRLGIYKKLNEIITMCGADVGFFVFSGAGTPFSFSYPSLESVVNRFMNPNFQIPIDNTQLVAEAYRKQRINELIREHEKFIEELEVEKEREKLFEKSAKEKDLDRNWWKTAVEDDKLDEDKVQQTYDAFVELYNNLCDTMNERMRLSGEGSSSGVAMYQPPNPHSGKDTNPPSSSARDGATGSRGH